MTLDQARERLGDVRIAKQRAQAEKKSTAREVKRLIRALGPRHPRVIRAEREHAASVAALDGARREERDTRSELARGLTEWLNERTDEVATLDPGVPIVLFPVRLETRFSVENSELRIRVYPDVVTADAFDAALTDRERALGEDYWRAAWEPSRELEAWTALLKAVKSARAAWIAHVLTPTNLDVRPAAAPEFPKTETRPDTWSRAVETRLLPDRWIAIAHRGGAEVGRVVGPVLPEPLALTLAPDAEEDELIEVSDGLTIDAEFLWALDFGKAEQAGMALRMPLGRDDLALGFDRLIVVGVKSSLPPARAAASLARVLEAQHYSRGLALIRQGTPTNNTGLSAAGYPPSSDPAHSFDIERGAPLSSEGSDGALLAAAFGVPAEVLSHVEGANGREQQDARAMASALWPATLGYYLEQMMWPGATAGLVQETRRHFEEYVRGRGPLPAFRAGGTPYGVLPVSSIHRWQPAAGTQGLDQSLPALLQKAQRVWLRQAAGVPRVGATDDPDADLLGIIGMDALPREARLRKVLGQAHQLNLAFILGVDIPDPPLAASMLEELGLAGLDARVLHTTFANYSYRFSRAMVTEEPLSEDATLAPNYIRWIRQSALPDLFAGKFPGSGALPLLARLLRHSALVEYDRIAVGLEAQNGLAPEGSGREPELIGIVAGTEGRPTFTQRFNRPIPSLTGAVSLADYLGGPSAPSGALSYRARLAQLEGVPTAELHRLLCETIGVCSSRLDAWITSIPTKRLEAMRRERPLESHIGAYGWVENLRPNNRPSTQGGYIQAPSMSHAAAAAVLRNAHITRSGEARSQAAIDLSSARVRMALRLLDGVRGGQPLGALLGYRFERVLHDRGLDVYIERFRRLYPLAIDATTAPEDPTQGLPIRDVVDGMALRTNWLGGTIPFGDANSGLPASGANDFTLLEGALQMLDDEVDATADVLLAEAVFQGVQGQMDGAAAALSAVASGARAPEPGVVSSPRGGIPITHRVAVAIGVPQGGGSWPTATPRAIAEPRLDAWAGTLLGDPAAVRGRIGDRVVTLVELGLRPIDVVALQPAEVMSRIRWAARDLPNVDSLPIVFDLDPSWDRASVRTFPEIIELAAAIRALTAASRPLESRDFVPPGSVESGWDLAEAAERFATSRTAFNDARVALAEALSAARANPASDLTPVRTSLLTVALFGLAHAVPNQLAVSSEAARNTLLDSIPEILSNLDRRIGDADAAANPVDGIRAIFGQEFVVLPLVTPPNADELSRALTHSPTLTADRWAVHRWLNRAAHVRSPLARLRFLTLIAEPLGGAPSDYDVAQLPHDEAGRWAALPFTDSRRPAPNTLSLVLCRVLDASANQPLGGLMIDEWTELIPSEVQSTGIAVHHDRPAAEAPQVVLVAVPPDPLRWDLPTLVDVLHETLDLAKVRGVDVDLLGDIARLLPGVFITRNVAGDTVSTSFSDALAADPTIEPQAEG